MTGNENLTDSNTVVQENLGENNSDNQLTEPSLANSLDANNGLKGQ